MRAQCRVHSRITTLFGVRAYHVSSCVVPYRVLRWVIKDPVRAEKNDMLSLGDIQDLLGLEVLGLIPESPAVLTATNLGQPVIMSEGEARRANPARFASGPKIPQKRTS